MSVPTEFENRWGPMPVLEVFVCKFIYICVFYKLVFVNRNVQIVVTFKLYRFSVIGTKLIKSTQNCDYVIPLCILISKKIRITY